MRRDHRGLLGLQASRQVAINVGIIGIGELDRCVLVGSTSTRSGRAAVAGRAPPRTIGGCLMMRPQRGWLRPRVGILHRGYTRRWPAARRAALATHGPTDDVLRDPVLCAPHLCQARCASIRRVAATRCRWPWGLSDIAAHPRRGRPARSKRETVSICNRARVQAFKSRAIVAHCFAFAMFLKTLGLCWTAECDRDSSLGGAAAESLNVSPFPKPPPISPLRTCPVRPNWWLMRLERPEGATRRSDSRASGSRLSASHHSSRPSVNNSTKGPAHTPRARATCGARPPRYLIYGPRAIALGGSP